MSTDAEHTEQPGRVETRAEYLLPEERIVGSDDPHAQAEAVLAESDLREEDRTSPPTHPGAAQLR